MSKQKKKKVDFTNENLDIIEENFNALSEAIYTVSNELVKLKKEIDIITNGQLSKIEKIIDVTNEDWLYFREVEKKEDESWVTWIYVRGKV